MYREDGKVVCQKCGAELDDNLLSADPCLIQSTSVIYHDGLYWFINVSDLHAELCIAKNIIGQTQYLKIRCTDKALAKKLHDLVICSVEEEGAINISGLYRFEIPRLAYCPLNVIVGEDYYAVSVPTLGVPGFPIVFDAGFIE